MMAEAATATAGLENEVKIIFEKLADLEKQIALVFSSHKLLVVRCFEVFLGFNSLTSFSNKAQKKVEEGNKLLTELLSKVSSGDLQQEVLEKQKFWKSSPLHQQIEQEYTLVHALRDEFQAVGNPQDCGWAKVHEEPTLTSYYKFDTRTSRTHFLIKGTMEAPLLNVVAVMTEVDLWPNWFPSVAYWGLSKSQLVHRPSRVHFLAQMMLNFPWPLTPREMMVDAFGVDALDELGLVIVYCKSASDMFHEFPVPAPPASHSRMKLNIGGFMVRPVNEKQCEVQIIFDVDPQIKYIPQKLLTTILSFLCHVPFKQLGVVSQNLVGTEYEQRVKEDKYGLFTFATERLAEHLASNK
eukprot:TRINITY_DN1958_c0_g1_i1.p1 TRINITY_DN1958_c0_g1~~TRINITY_DN1958_c0_g1_i1.p1  ORF type:complete len:353 (-),score=73.31 TRINITY_DN1958_c0_g1_i1:160-1218(-)